MSRKLDKLDKMSDKMSSVSSVSNSSKFSVRSQQVIAKQDDLIAKMRRILIDAGIDPDAVQPDSVQPSPVQVCGDVVWIVQVQYARHARYNWYVQSMKAAKVRKAPDQVQIQVATVVPVAQAAPAASTQAPPQVGYPALVAPVVQVALVAPVQAPHHAGNIHP